MAKTLLKSFRQCRKEPVIVNTPHHTFLSHLQFTLETCLQLQALLAQNKKEKNRKRKIPKNLKKKKKNSGAFFKPATFLIISPHAIHVFLLPQYVYLDKETHLQNLVNARTRPSDQERHTHT